MFGELSECLCEPLSRITSVFRGRPRHLRHVAFL